MYTNILEMIACWCDTHISTPIRLSQNSTSKRPKIVDSEEFIVELYPDVKPILDFLEKRHIIIFTASRTAKPRIAKKMLKLFGLEKYIYNSEWGYYSKVEHIQQLVNGYNSTLKNVQSEPLTFSEICLFDDEWRNSDVEKKLGVKFCHLPNEQLTWQNFHSGIEGWRKKKAATNKQAPLIHDISIH